MLPSRIMAAHVSDDEVPSTIRAVLDEPRYEAKAMRTPKPLQSAAKHDQHEQYMVR